MRDGYAPSRAQVPGAGSTTGGPACGDCAANGGSAWAASMLVAGSGSLAGPLAAGNHTFSLRLRSTAALSSGASMLCASNPTVFRCQLEVWALRR